MWAEKRHIDGNEQLWDELHVAQAPEEQLNDSSRGWSSELAHFDYSG